MRPPTKRGKKKLTKCNHKIRIVFRSTKTIKKSQSKVVVRQAS